jgi:arylsulfatase A-like enzyme
MHRRTHVTPARFAFLACAMLAIPSASLRGAERPNILWITVEDMSPRLGAYGDDTVPTPTLDRLAREGVRFTRAFGVYGVCAPNRHALILGMYPTSTGAMAMRTWKRTSAIDQITDPELLAIPTYEATPPPEARCFPEYLRAAGYFCTNNAKTDYQFRDPVTTWDESGKQAHWRNRPRTDMPFFSVFNFTVTHESGTFEARSPAVTDPSAVVLPPYYPDTPIVRRDLARHYDNIAATDGLVARVLGELEEDGLAASTIVFFFSDHGDGLPRAKRWVYDSGIHVPLIVRFPDGSDAGTTNGELVSFVDFAPTVLSLAGVAVPPHMQGQPFLGAAKASPRRYVYAARDRMDPAPETIRTVRDARFKYVRNYRPDLPYIGFIPYRDRAGIMQEIHRLAAEGGLGPEQWQLWATSKPLEELYDTESDPHEIHNLAGQPEHMEKLAELRQAHLKWTEETGDLGHISEEQLIWTLWPPDGVQPNTADPVIESDAGKGDRRLVRVTCDSLGASIVYRLEEGGRWRLYVEPFEVPAGATVWSQANRLGWKHSEVVSAVIR